MQLGTRVQAEFDKKGVGHTIPGKNVAQGEKSERLTLLQGQG